MKKYLFWIAIVPFVISSCKTKDNYPPTIFLSGDNPMRVTLGTMYTDPGATADDNFDGAGISSKIENTHNIPNTTNVTSGNCITKEHGDWTVTYTVSDKAGNQTSKTRTVQVRNDAFMYAQTEFGSACVYSFSKTGGTNLFPNFSNQPVSLDFDKRVNNRIYFTKLSGKNGMRIYADIQNDTLIAIPDQSKIFVENGDSVLYRVRGDIGQSFVLDTIPTSFHLRIKYQIDRYLKGTPTNYQHVYDGTYWRDVNNYSINTENYIQWE